eukprot:TRINITY_DN1367_c0_g1_i3.p1 TRINITY_DN1367_c0_g1~~TRINITY_DN1367_c0_g1_i3.p1  ORF type:complete len:383 (-),score=101.27 TRINITY_DN1367_c0_g1_i3:561-1709(-)
MANPRYDPKYAAVGTPPAPPSARYWYPARSYSIQEVRQGYVDTLTSSSRIIWFAPLLLVVMFMFRRNTFVDAVIEELCKAHDASVVGMVIFPCCLLALVVLTALYLVSRRVPVYLLDFAVFTPPDRNRITLDGFGDLLQRSGWFAEESLEFQRRLVARSGLGDNTYFPDGILANPPELSQQKSREEALQLITGCLDELFAKTQVSPQDIDFVIVNCSLFCPTPSISSMIINKYKMRKDVRNYNLSGMGCSAGLISIDLAKDLLQTHRSKYCLVFSFENITENWYKGQMRPMLMSNCLFRMGAAAILLTNKRELYPRAKYTLQTTVRVHHGADDTAYQAIYQMEDGDGKKGVRISRDLVRAVGDVLKSNVTILAPQARPLPCM